MKRNYKEGTWFAVPLRKGGYGIGVVARAKRTCVLAYFFGPRRESVPQFEEIAKLTAHSAVAKLRVGDLGLINGEWPVIGHSLLKHTDWPVPVFVRRERFPPYKNWLVYYSDTDPNERINEVPESNDRPDLPADSLSGYGAAETKLTKLLCLQVNSD
jgi:hypothetical protein